MKDLSLFPYAHPVMASVGLLLAFVVFRQGMAQRAQRLRRVTAPPATLKRHVALGPWAVGLLGLSTVGGMGSAVLLRGWDPLATWHGRLGLVCAAAFGLMWWLGRRLLAQQKHLANRHGVLGVLTLFLSALVAILGISLLP